jgi:hypothetical protein
MLLIVVDAVVVIVVVVDVVVAVVVFCHCCFLSFLLVLFGGVAFRFFFSNSAFFLFDCVLLQALIIRHTLICHTISILFEFLEYSLTFHLPNFHECWWDHVSHEKRIAIRRWEQRP